MPKVKRITTVIIGEGPTEYFYLNSLKDEFRELQNIKPDFPKNTSLGNWKGQLKKPCQWVMTGFFVS